MRLAVLVLICALTARADSLVQILSGELNRNFTALKQKGDPPPYFMAYEVTETENESIAAANGAIIGHSDGKSRVLDITVRVGTPKLDNYQIVSGQRPRFTPGSLLPIDDVPNALRRDIWMQTDRTYRAAAQRLIRIKSDQQINVAASDDSDDFSSEDPSTFDQMPPRVKFDSVAWVPRLRQWSAMLAANSGVVSSAINLSVRRETRYLVTTEGTRVVHGRIFSNMSMIARGKAQDGMDLEALETFQVADPSHLPKAEAVQAAVQRTGSTLSKLVLAPVVEPYVGPAILSGRAAGVFFHEIFGHRIEGHRQRDDAEGQTFTKKIGTPVLPTFLSVVFDPTREALNGADLNGYYSYDDEGVKARPVTIVDNGILKTFLMSRTPVKGFAHSNGHGRRQPGFEIVSRQSNLLVESSNRVSDQKLREMLIAEVKRQGKPYGLYFDQVTGGYTTTQRRGLQAFTVIPLVVYKVFADGRPDELVRGADIVGTPLASFAKIVATSDHQEIFNGYCGAESGSVPVSAVSPALLVSEIEVQKKDHGQDRPPLLPPPSPPVGQAVLLPVHHGSHS